MDNPNIPYFSIIIPTKNEATIIGQCLEPFKNQTTKRAFEIFVVDTNSKDRTREIAQSYGATVISEPHPGKSIAFQTGVSHAQGEILCFTEADCIVTPHWLDTIDQTFQNHSDAVAVTGGYRFHDTTPWYIFMSDVLHPLFSIYGYRLIFGHYSLRCSNFAIRKDIMDKIGGFNTENQELYDVELGRKSKNFGKNYYNPKMKIQTMDRRLRGRFFSFLKEFSISFMTVVVRGKPLTKKIYKDVR
jgi:glycosyltransferase involved in cell wall biosynthesis